MKRTKLKAWEVEMEMQEARENRTVDGELIPFKLGVEKSVVKDIVKQAKSSGKIGDKMFVAVNPVYLHIPNWQRQLRISVSLSIGENYNPAKWDSVKVVCDNGKLYVIDGMHRIYGAFKAGIESIIVELLDITMDEAIDLFLNQSKERSSMSPCDYYNAAIEAKKPEYMLFKNICRKNNIQIKGDYSEDIKNPIGIFTSLSDGISLAKSNPELLDKILQFINKLQWNGADIYAGRAYSAKVIRVFKKLYAYYENDEKSMETSLLLNCKGSEYYNTHLDKKFQDSFFDHLSKVIESDVKRSTVTFTDVKRRKVN